MKLRAISLAAVLALAAFAASAHGEQKHVLGTLEKVSADSVVVKTGPESKVEVKLVSSTAYVTPDGKPAKFSDLAAGQRVAIHATARPDGTLEAATVKFSAAAAPAPAKSQP